MKDDDIMVLKFWPKANGNPVVVKMSESGDLISSIIESGCNEIWCCEMVKMDKKEFEKLKEHQGW